MSDIPRARWLITSARTYINHALEQLQEAETLMIRPAPVRKAKAKPRKEEGKTQ